MVYIYGSGAYGIHAYYMLKQYGVTIDGFIDRNAQKRGYFFDGISCMTLDDLELVQVTDGITIVVCLKNGINQVIETIKRHGIQHIYTMQQYRDEYLSQGIPSKLPAINDIVYLLGLKEAFSQAFYDDVLDEKLDSSLFDIVHDLSVRGKIYECSPNQ